MRIEIDIPESLQAEFAALFAKDEQGSKEAVREYWLELLADMRDAQNVQTELDAMSGDGITLEEAAEKYGLELPTREEG